MECKAWFSMILMVSYVIHELHTNSKSVIYISEKRHQGSVKLMVLFAWAYSFPKKTSKMWPALMGAMRVYAPYITLPAAMVIGFIGYNFENLIGRAETPWKKKSIIDEREERLLQESANTDYTQVESLKNPKSFVPATILDRNTPRSSWGFPRTCGFRWLLRFTRRNCMFWTECRCSVEFLLSISRDSSSIHILI